MTANWKKCWTWIHHNAAFITFLVLASSIVLAAIEYHDIRFLHTPPGALNTHALGNSEDYHQYMYIIKLGREGHILYHNAFSEESIPDVLLQPMYTLLGFISQPFNLSLYSIYFIAQITSLAILFFCIFTLINKTLTKQIDKWFAVILYFSATGFWSLKSFNPFFINTHPLPYYNFDPFLKYHVIPPHHNIAIALMIGIFLFLSSPSHSFRIRAGIFSLLIGLIHPYIQLLMFVMLFVRTVVQSISERKIVTHALIDAVTVIGISLPVVLWNVYMQAVILRFSIGTAGILSYLPRAESIRDYVLSLGPVFLLAIPSLWYWQRTKNPLIQFMLYWGFVPMILFFFPDVHLPINTWRLFQIYQHIPFAILSAYTLSRLMRNVSRYTVIVIMIGICSLLYGGTVYAWEYYENALPTQADFFYNINVPNDILTIFHYLDRQTPKDSVILAGGILSNLVPEFTHNRVIIGHNGDNRNYLAKLHDIGTFLSNKTPPADVRAFLTKYTVSYIIFGIDAPEFHKTPYDTLPFLQEIAVFGDGMSIVKVTPEHLLDFSTSP